MLYTSLYMISSALSGVSVVSAKLSIATLGSLKLIEFLLRELKSAQALFAASILAVGHQVGGLSDSKKILMLKEIAKARRMHGMSFFSWIWAIVYIRELIRKKLLII